MKSSPITLITILFFLAACGSGDAGQFEGTWQSLDNPSQQIVFNRSGKNVTFATKNFESSFEGLTGTYKKENNAVEFIDANGDTTALVYNSTTRHISGLGTEFTKAGEAVSDESEEVMGAVEETVMEEETSTTASTVYPKATSATSSCAKGEILVITGNNVRLRNEPDVTKQNILMQVHKNFEVVRIQDKTVDGQKWYKVCYEGNIGWVSGQYASAK